MRVFHSVSDVPAAFGPSAVTIGNFDGVHVGHRQILRRLIETGLTPVVLTFDPHPAKVLAPDRAPQLLMTVAQKLRMFEVAGVETVLLLPFSLEFAKLTPEDFAWQILAETLNAKVVMVGEDFRFGYKQAGNIETLKSLGEVYGFEVSPVGAIERRAERISSTAIRKLITDGAVSRACRVLGSPFALTGEVVRGQGIGSKQTVPTLNLAPENEVLPKNGVYVTRTKDFASARAWPSITNVGYRPTFNGQGLTIETFLLAPFDGDTPVRIEVEFLAFLRDERRFESPEALRAQILHDAGVASRLHRRLAKLRM